MNRPSLRFSAVAIITTLVFSPLFAEELPAPPTNDPISHGLWWLYHLQYEKAHEVFEQYSQSHPTDPAGPFYKMAVDWWQLAQQLDYPLPTIEKRMDEDYAQTVKVGQALYQSAITDEEKAQASLYLGGAEGLRGRWLVTQRVWVKAYFAGRRGHKWLLKSLHYDPNMYDAYMGLGIYDYFTDTLSGVVGALSGLLVHGDRKRGLKELQLAIDKGQHARVESLFFLIEIYTFEEKKPELALPLTQQLRVEFPHSPAVHLAVITAYYSLARWADVKRESQFFLEESEKEVPYFTHDGIRPARYCLGVSALYGDHDVAQCLIYMNQILAENTDSSRWVTFAYLRQGQVYDVQGDRAKAVEDYKKVLNRTDFWGSHDEANLYLKKPYK